MIYDFSSTSELQKTFDEFNKNVLRNQQNFVLLVHATWCGHCLRLMPIWKDCTKNHSKLNIVNIDSEVYNHLQKNNKSHIFTRFLDENVQGFPTLLKIENKRIIPFEGDRDKTSIKKFLKNKSLQSEILKKYAHK